MKRLLALTAFLLASTAAQAQYTFQYGGYTIHVDPDRGRVSIPGVYDNTGRHTKKAKADQDGARKAQEPRQEPQQAKVDPQPAVSPDAATATPSAAPASNPPGEAAVLPPAPSPAPSALPAQQSAAAPAVTPPSAPPPPAPAIAAAPTAPVAARVQQAAPVTAAARDVNSPLGVWLTEEKEGKVRIEPCGANLCGYSVDSKSNQNGEQVLINMKPGKDLKWTGRILDPNTGSTYDSTIAMRGPDTLRVQGCAFGGMFCGGQTWSRVN